MIRNEIEKTALAGVDISSPDTGSQRFCPGIDFVGFNGHFPGYPILPAMLQVLFGVLVSEKIWQKKLVLKKLVKAKFMAQIKPNETITVTCKIMQTSPARPQSAAIKAKVTITVAEKKAASMTLLLDPA